MTLYLVDPEAGIGPATEFTQDFSLVVIVDSNSTQQTFEIGMQHKVR